MNIYILKKPIRIKWFKNCKFLHVLKLSIFLFSGEDFFDIIDMSIAVVSVEEVGQLLVVDVSDKLVGPESIIGEVE